MKRLLDMYSKWKLYRNRSFLELLENNSSAKVLDLGCGDGRFTLKARERIGTKRVYGVDIYDPSIERAKSRGIHVIKWDLNEFPYPFKDNEFDVVLSNQVIEHLFYPVKFMREVFRLLKPGGYAVISTENLASWDNIVALVFGYLPFSMGLDSGVVKLGNPLSPHNGEVLEKTGPPHVRILTLRALIELSKFVGFKVERVIGTGHFLGRLGDKIDKRHTRFITIKLRKPSDKAGEGVNRV